MKSLTIYITLAFCWISMVYSQTWDELNQKVKEYYNRGDYPTAIEYAEKAKAQSQFEFGKEHYNYAISLNNLAGMYQSMGKYSKAEPIFIESLNIRRKILGPEHPDYATSLNNLAALYNEIGNFAKAESLHIEAYNIRKKVLGVGHPDYAKSLNNLAILYAQMGNYPKAELLFLEGLNINRKMLGVDHPEYATSLDNLARIYRDMGNYVKAEQFCIKAFNIRKKILGPDHPYYAISLDNLAGLFQDKGDYKKAESLYIEALNFRKKSLGSNHPYYAISLNNLASLYSDQGNYLMAEPLYIEASNIFKKVFGPDHPEYATPLNNLAILYGSMGNYAKAESLFIEVLNIRKKVLGPDHPDYTISLGNLAVLYYKMGNYAKAEPLFLEASEIFKKVLGQDHPDYAKSLDNLSGQYHKMGNYAKAEPLIVEALNLRKKLLGPDHPEYAISLNNLALLYDDIGKYSKAELLYIEALNITKKVLGPDHPEYATSLNNLALLYDDIGKYSKAESLFVQANDNLNNQINSNFNFLSEKEKELFLNNNINYHFEIYNSFFLRRKDINPSVCAVSYNNELAHKGMLLQSNSNLRQAVYDHGDSTIISIYDRFIDLHKKLSIHYTSPIAERKENADSLENIANDLEKELIVKGKDLPGVENLTGLTKIKWQDVQQTLKPDEVAIEFVDFSYYDKRWTDSTYYCALVLHKDYEYPKMIFLFEEKQLREIISIPKATSNAFYITQLYSNKTNLNNQPTTQNILYSLIWEPIDSLLQGINTIYLAPSGLLHKIAFNAIPIANSTLLSDKYNINVVSSTRILAKGNRAAISLLYDDKAALFGGIEYDVDSSEMVALVRSYQKPGYDLLTGRSISIPEGNRGITWIYLPGTFTEVSNIQKILKSKLITSSLYTGKNATEESFKFLTDKVKSPEIMHIATHGFYFPEINPEIKVIGKAGFRVETFDRQIFSRSGNPLLRSGILFAGAGRVWNNLDPLPQIEDGTLTSYEISNINLSNTKLVVLSACETGLGDIKGSEGVYGLQRAFKMAGVKYIVMSLWQVPDYQTSELMQLFYTNCLNGLTIKDGFYTAQQTMRKKYDPFYWAAFVLIE